MRTFFILALFGTVAFLIDKGFNHGRVVTPVLRMLSQMARAFGLR